MKIIEQRLHHNDGSQTSFVESPNQGGQVDARYLIMHYTAGGSAAGAIRTLTDPDSKASAHLVIARDGTVTQLVPFDRIAWHAGKSRWHGLEGLNKYSLGIELANAGLLERHGAKWRAWFGGQYGEDEVIEAVHQHETVVRGWHVYSEEQLAAAVRVGRLLVRQYGLRDVLGHDDIAPGRKRDPGPAFPMHSYRAAVLGRQEDALDLCETTTHLNIREGPGTDFAKLPVSPLPPGTLFRLHDRQARWCQVEVLDRQGVPSETGWVYGDYVRPAS